MKKNLVLFILLIVASMADAAKAETRVLHIQEVTSPGGIKAWLVQDDKLPLIAMSFAFRGGVEQDPVDKQGLAELTAALMTQGAGHLDAEAFQQKLADQSIQFAVSAGRDEVQGSLKTLRETRATAFDLLRLALTQPRFDDEDFERTRNQQLTVMKAELGSADWQARRALFAHIFKDHPYGMRHYGTAATLKTMTRDDVRTFAARHFARDNLVVAVAGAMTPQELGKSLDAVFGGLPEKAQLTPVPEFNEPVASTAILVKREGTQTEMLFAMPMLRRSDPDWYAADIVNYSLGGGRFSSRLMHEVRDRAGLTYGIATSLAPMDRASLLVGNAATDNPKTGQAWEKVRQVWQDIYVNGLTDSEIEAAKDYLTGSLPLALTSTNAIANVLLSIQLNCLGRDYLDRRDALIRQVSAEDVRRVIKRWFNPESLAVVMVGEPEGVSPTITEEQVQE